MSLAVVAAVAADPPSAGEDAFGQVPAPPNVLVIVTDDQRASGTLRAMPETQRLFRREGRRYPNAFATTPLCCPSRATILTGRYAHNTGVRTNGHGRRLDAATTFPRLLQEAGYATGLSGKFLNTWRHATPPPYFDHYAVIQPSRGQYVNPTFNLDGSTRSIAGYSTNVIGRYATRFLHRFETEDARPWFLYVAPTAPHQPWRPARKYRRSAVGRWRGNPAVLERDRSDKPLFVRRMAHTLAGVQRVRAGQLRTLMSVDDMVGNLFRTLTRLGEAETTLAIYASDNGFIWSEHGIGRRGGPGQKRLPYTASTQIPLFLRWPTRIAAGSVDPRLTGTVDLAPTVLDAAGVPPDPGQPPIDGRSLLGADVRDRLLLEYWGVDDRDFPTWASIRTRSFQFTEYYREDGATVRFREHYGFRRDRWQLRNLLRDGTPRNDPDVASLGALLARDRACAGTVGPGACP